MNGLFEWFIYMVNEWFIRMVSFYMVIEWFIHMIYLDVYSYGNWRLNGLLHWMVYWHVIR